MDRGNIDDFADIDIGFGMGDFAILEKTTLQQLTYEAKESSGEERTVPPTITESSTSFITPDPDIIESALHAVSSKACTPHQLHTLHRPSMRRNQKKTRVYIHSPREIKQQFERIPNFWALR